MHDVTGWTDFKVFFH